MGAPWESTSNADNCGALVGEREGGFWRFVSPASTLNTGKPNRSIQATHRLIRRIVRPVGVGTSVLFATRKWRLWPMSCCTAPYGRAQLGSGDRGQADRL